MSTERMMEPIAPAETVIQPLENKETTERRRARHLADAAFIDGFYPMSNPETSFLAMRNYLREYVIEQDEAIEAIVEAIDASNVRPESDPQPIATLAFLGPTGVGKSELAKALSRWTARNTGEPSLVKIDCTDYSNGHEVSRLNGAPPSFVGREQKPILNAEDIERKGTIVLFDEIEKGAQELHNLMLQIMEDGKLTLNDGTVTNFRNTILIMTSNLGAKEMTELTREFHVGFGAVAAPVDKKALESSAHKAFADFFRPEFKNRIDSMIVFHPLSGEGMEKVLDVKLDEVNRQYEDQFGARISLSEGTRKYLVDLAAEERHMGARPMVRGFKKKVLRTFGQYVGMEAVEEHSHLRVYHRDEVPNLAPTETRDLLFFSKHDTSIKKAMTSAPQPQLFTIEDQIIMVAEENKAKKKTDHPQIEE